MTPARKVLIFSAVVLFGVWGCARGPASKKVETQRVKLLEARCAKLEDDYRTVATTRDRLRRQIIDVHQERSVLEEQLEVERQNVAAMQTQLEQEQQNVAAMQLQLKKERQQVAAMQEQLEGVRDSYEAAHEQTCEELQLAKQESGIMQQRVDRLKRGLQELLGEDDSIYSTKTTTTLRPTMSFVDD